MVELVKVVDVVKVVKVDGRGNVVDVDGRTDGRRGQVGRTIRKSLRIHQRFLTIASNLSQLGKISQRREVSAMWQKASINACINSCNKYCRLHNKLTY